MARILIIEDDPDIRSVLRQILEWEGYTVVDAQDGLQGMRRFLEAPCDLVITDLLMPGMSGSAVISKLRRRFPDLKIIAISGGGIAYGPCGYLDFARELGAQCTLLKPIRRDTLLEAVRDMLEASS